jgi:hypothetical protein
MTTYRVEYESGPYGNQNETFFVNRRGEIYLIQGPDMRPGEAYHLCRDLPKDAEPVAADGIEIPPEIA